MAKQMIGTYGYGTLIGYQTYEVRGRNDGEMQAVHLYYVLCAEDKNKDTGLYSVCAVKELRQTEQTLKTLKAGTPVKYKVVISEYDGHVRERLSDIEEFSL